MTTEPITITDLAAEMGASPAAIAGMAHELASAGDDVHIDRGPAVMGRLVDIGAGLLADSGQLLTGTAADEIRAHIIEWLTATSHDDGGRAASDLVATDEQVAEAIVGAEGGLPDWLDIGQVVEAVGKARTAHGDLTAQVEAGDIDLFELSDECINEHPWDTNEFMYFGRSMLGIEVSIPLANPDREADDDARYVNFDGSTFSFS